MAGMRIGVLGANGQLGTDLCQALQGAGHELTRWTHADFDVCDGEALEAAVDAVRPEVLVNTTAFHKVEACESDPARAFAVNASALRAMAQACERLEVTLVHLSTDYVFDGTGQEPWSEMDPVNPINVYGVSKAAGEFLVQNLCPRHLVVRSSGLYGLRGASGKGGNFVETMLRKGAELGAVTVVDDQVLSPTSTLDLAEAISRLIAGQATGLFHVTNSGACSWYEFACAIFEEAGMAVKTTPARTVVQPSGVRRPAFSVLANDRLKAKGFGRLRPWRQALRAYLNNRIPAAAMAAL
jgi:dTDP-4-dehydrorhamnose reductase